MASRLTLRTSVAAATLVAGLSVQPAFAACEREIDQSNAAAKWARETYRAPSVESLKASCYRQNNDKGPPTEQSIKYLTREFEDLERSTRKDIGLGGDHSKSPWASSVALRYCIKKEELRLAKLGCIPGQNVPSSSNGKSDSGSIASTGSVDFTKELPSYRGPTPQSSEECMAMVKGGARERGFKDPVDQIGQHLACLAEWRKIQQARQGNQSTQNAGQTPEQQMTQRATAQAHEAQAKGDADAKKQGRRRHDPAMEAHECINLNSGPNPINSCSYKVNVIACVTEPRQTQNMMNNNEMFQCGGKSGGLWNPSPGGSIYGIYPRTAGMVHWFACKDPAEPMEVTFDGTHLQGRCRVLFAN